MNNDKCEFCKGAGKEPGEPGCVWCLNTGTKEGQALLTPPAQQHQGEPVAWMYTRPEVEWPAFYDKRKDAVGWKETPLYTHADPAEVERLREGINKHWKVVCDQRAEIDTLRAGFYQKVTDADLKKIHDYVSNPDLPKGAFLRQDAYDLANFTAHMCREVQASRVKLAEAHALLSEVAESAAWGIADLRMRIEKVLSASVEPSAPLPTVDGDLLPPIGSKVLIHLAREDEWVEHTVVGYYAWGNHGLEERVHRVFVRVRDADGYLNARLLNDVRPVALERKP